VKFGEFVEQRSGSGMGREDAADGGEREGAEADGAVEGGTSVGGALVGGGVGIAVTFRVTTRVALKAVPSVARYENASTPMNPVAGV
jgi:hypothetical protein